MIFKIDFMVLDLTRTLLSQVLVSVLVLVCSGLVQALVFILQVLFANAGIEHKLFILLYLGLEVFFIYRNLHL